MKTYYWVRIPYKKRKPNITKKVVLKRGRHYIIIVSKRHKNRKATVSL